MFNNYIKIAVRHGWHNKLYSLINIAGLSIAVSCVLLAVLFIKDENSFDRFHEKKGNLYRVITSVTGNKGEKEKKVGGTGQVQGPAFKAAVPEIQDYARLLGGDIFGDIAANDKVMNLRMLFVDESFFNIFSFRLLKGNRQDVLKEINSVVLTETMSRKFFNSIDVVGKTIQLDADPSAKRLGKPLIISGVVQDPPTNSSIRFDALFTLKFMQLSFEDNAWLNQYLGTFVLLNPGADIDGVAKKFDRIFARQAKEQIAENIRRYGYDPQISYGLQPITDIHLNPMPSGPGGREGGIINEGNPVYSWMFLGIAVFILAMAAINFINMSIAGSLKRAKEVGVRKITGGSKFQIIIQFLSESALLCLLAFLLAIVLTNSCLPVFNHLSGKEIAFSVIFDGELFLWFFIIFIAVILLTGLYPAYALSRFKPTQVLYNKQNLSGRNLLGRALVVVQFSLSVFFVLVTMIYYRQMDYVRTKDLGYNPYHIIRSNIPGDREIKPVQQLLKNELAGQLGIQYISFGGESNAAPVTFGNKTVDAVHRVVDENYLPAMEIPLIAGRNFSPVYPTDRTNAVIVNEAFVKAAGLTNTLGTQLHTNDYFDKEIKTIVGVVKDFHFGSLRSRIQPLVMIMNSWYSSGIWIKIEKTRMKEGLAAFESAYKKVMPGAVFQYRFLDELNAKEYLQEQRWQKIIGLATILSIVICCLGLFGLAHLATNQRMKEIGIRKVLGASVAGIASLLSKDFLKLVILGFVIASPVAWWVMNDWLQDFAYRIQIGWGIFILAALLTITLALVTVSLQTIKAGLMNPVKSLRSE